MSDYKTTGLQDHRMRRGRPPSPGYGVPGRSVVVPPRHSYGAAGSSQWSSRERGFTLAELLVSMVVLVILVFLATQLVNSAATVTILGHKKMDTDAEARQVFDRMAVDFAYMVKRTDVDCYVKNSSVGLPQDNQNDQIAFYSAVPGYYPSTSTSMQQSPLSLVGYRVNSDQNSPSYNKLERLGKGLVWNGVSAADTPAVFLPLTIAATWPAATSSSAADPAYEVIGPDVFRFEYSFLLTNGDLKATPCSANPCTLNGWNEVSAIVVAIAVIDPRTKGLLSPADIATLNNGNFTNFLVDFSNDYRRPGQFLTKWQTKVNLIAALPSGISPRQAISSIRWYERYFYLNH